MGDAPLLPSAPAWYLLPGDPDTMAYFDGVATHLQAVTQQVVLVGRRLDNDVTGTHSIL